MLSQASLRQVLLTVTTSSTSSFNPVSLALGCSTYPVGSTATVVFKRFLTIQTRLPQILSVSDRKSGGTMTPGMECKGANDVRKRLLTTTASLDSKKPGSPGNSIQVLSGKPKPIDKNLSLWTSISAPASSKTSSSGAKSTVALEEEDQRPKKLLIMFAYMLPQERHLEKYRSIYFQHGFDVLTVKTSPFEFFFPTIGAQKVAASILNFMKSKSSEYPEVIVHAFSVGGYQFAEFLNKLNESDDDKLSPQHLALKKSIKGTIFDSPCDVDSVPYGLSRTVAGDNFLATILEAMVNLTRNIFYPLSTKYHKEGMEVFTNKPLLCPSLFFASKTDKMANIAVIEEVIKIWTDKGCDVSLKKWENTRHVSHYHAYPKEYMTDVQDFLKKINII